MMMTARELTGLALPDNSDAAKRNLPMPLPIDIDRLRMCELSRNEIRSLRRESRQGDGAWPLRFSSSRY
jgi:hypothetical protein